MVRMVVATSLIFTAALFDTLVAYAAPSGVTYQGRIIKPDGTPLNGANVQFRLQIRAPDSNNCLMYEELQAQNMSGSSGNFSLTINDGSGIRQDATGLGLDRIFANRGTFNFDPATCASGSSFVAGTSDGRVLQVYFKDETMAAWEPMPPQKINYVPFAFEAKQIAGFTASNLLRFAEPDGTLVNTTPLNNAQYTELLAILNGSSTTYERAGRLGGVSLPTLGAGQAGQVLSWNGTGWETATPQGGATSQWSNGASGAVSYVGGNVGIGTDAPTSSSLVVNTPAGSSNTLILDLQDNGVSKASIDKNGNASFNYAEFANGLQAQAYSGSAYTPTSSTINYVPGAIIGVTNNSASYDTSFGGISMRARNTAGTHMQSFIGAVSNAAGLSPSTVFVHQTGANSYAERMRIHSDGNVGIGTAAPDAKLHIAGGGVHATGNSRFDLDISWGGTLYGPYSVLSRGESTPYSPASSTVSNPAGIRLKLGNEWLVDNNYSGMQLGSTNSSGNAQEVYLGSISNQGASVYAPTFVIGQKTGATAYAERLRLDSAGRVGIGTTAPAYALDVNGVINATGLKINGADITAGAGGTPGGANKQVQYNNSGSFAGNSGFTYDATNGYLGLNVTPDAAISAAPKDGYLAAKLVGNATYKDVQLKLEGYDYTGRLMIDFNRPGTSAHSINVDGNDNFFWGIGSNFNSPGQDLINMAANGNVAIGKGITAPNAKLDVKGSIVMSGSSSGFAGFRVPAAAGSSVWQLPAADGVSGQALVTNGSGVLSWNSMAASNYWTKAVSDISYTAGNVGIGVATPATKLDVNGDASFVSAYIDRGGMNAGALNYGLTFGSAGLSTEGIASKRTVGGNRYGLDFYTNGTNRMAITNTGSVGLGTTAPVANLQVESNFGTTLLIQNNNPTSNSHTNIQLRNFRGYQGEGDPHIISYAARGWPESPANVISGMKLMSLQGNGFAEAGYGADRTGASIDMVAASDWGNSTIPTHITFRTGTVGDWNTFERVRISASGLVGIGTTMPSELLEVAGNVKATSFIQSSDARLKTDIKATPGLDIIQKLTGVQWQWRMDGKTDAGVIAQQLEKVMPYAVVTDEKSGYKAVKYNALFAPLIQSTKELRAQNLELKKENEALKARLDSLEKSFDDRLKALEAKLKK